TRDNPAQLRRLRELETLSRRRIELSQELVELRSRKVVVPADLVANVVEGKGVMESIRTLTDAMDEEEERLLADRVRALEKDTRETNLIIAAGGCFSIVTILIVGLVIGNDIGRSVGTLVSAAQRLQAGDLAYRVPNHATDETRTLAEAFHRIAGQLAD